MQDMRKMQDMGAMTEEFVDGAQKTIDEAEAGKELDAMWRRINALESKKSQEKPRQVPKHCKKPLPKNAKKRARKNGTTLYG